jgi:SAM-dependent methyltransferase/alkylhydroperoxidase family enzyme
VPTSPPSSMAMSRHSPEASGDARPAWHQVDDGWGRRAADFATLTEPSNCREYVALHHHLGVGPGDRLLDMACGAGLAVELASAIGATCSGIDASRRLIAVARDRNPRADVRVGDMHDLPWPDASFDVVTSFRGIWATTPDAVAEAYRVLVPGGRLGITVWGHIKGSPGAWMMEPLAMASEPKVAHQAAMVALGRPGAGEALLSRCGFVDIERHEIPFVAEFADPETYARAIASVGPAYEAIETIGEEEFIRSAIALARQRVRDGLPLRAPIASVGYVGRKPSTARLGDAAPSPAMSFLDEAPPSPGAQRLFDDDLRGLGFVMNSSKIWAHDPVALDGFSNLLAHVVEAGALTFRQRAILVTASASTLGDSYCSLAWGKKLAGDAGATVAEGVLRGDDTGLDRAEQALASWARQLARDPNSTKLADVQSLRAAGFDDAQIFAVSVFVALRIAFSTVNDALGARPDWQLGVEAPAPVRDAVTFGRPIATAEPNR